MERDLCGACVAKLKVGFSVRKIAGGVDQKVICAECRRRRYGGTYEVSKKEPPIVGHHKRRAENGTADTMV